MGGGGGDRGFENVDSNPTRTYIPISLKFRRTYEIHNTGQRCDVIDIVDGVGDSHLIGFK